jgi:hypothetical protein
MTVLLSEIVEGTLRKLGALQVNAATGGTTTTIVDADLAGSDDDFNGGTAIIIRDAGGAGAAPENEFSEVTDYATATGTLTVNTLTVTPASGDVYGVSTGKDYPHYQVIASINAALQYLGDYPQMDTTTLDTASNQTEYAAAVNWKRRPPYRIDIQGKTTDANDNKWRKIERGRWEYVPAAPGSTGLIIFNFQPTASRGLRVWFQDKHPEVAVYNSAIYEGFHPELIIWQAVYELLLWKNGQQPGDKRITAQLNNAESKRIEMYARHGIWKPKRDSKLLILGRTTETDKFTYPGPA